MPNHRPSLENHDAYRKSSYGTPCASQPKVRGRQALNSVDDQGDDDVLESPASHSSYGADRPPKVDNPQHNDDDDLEYINDDYIEEFDQSQTDPAHRSDHNSYAEDVTDPHHDTGYGSRRSIPVGGQSPRHSRHSDSPDDNLSEPVGDDPDEFWNPENEDEELRSGEQAQNKNKPSGLRKLIAQFKTGRGKQGKKALGYSEPNIADLAKQSLVPTRRAIVVLLDGTDVEFPLPLKATGEELFFLTCQTLDLVEKDYFGLTYVSNRPGTWVKFYAPDPMLLHEELTRYQLMLQLRHDIYKRKLACSWVTQALLGSFLVQSALGDYNAERTDSGHPLDYLRQFEIIPNATRPFLEKVAELHRSHV